MPEMVAKLNAKIPTGPNTINLHLNGFDIPLDYDSFSSKSIVTMSHGVLIKMEGSDWLCEWDSKRMELCVGLHPLYLRL